MNADATSQFGMQFFHNLSPCSTDRRCQRNSSHGASTRTGQSGSGSLQACFQEGEGGGQGSCKLGASRLPHLSWQLLCAMAWILGRRRHFTRLQPLRVQAVTHLGAARAVATLDSEDRVALHSSRPAMQGCFFSFWVCFTRRWLW